MQNGTLILERSQQQYHQLEGHNGKEIYEFQSLQYAEHMQQPQQHQAHLERLNHQLLPSCAGIRQQWLHGPLGKSNAQNCVKDKPLSPSVSVDNWQNVRHYSLEKAEGPPPCKSNHAKDHILAERKRREKLSQRFIALAAMLPGLKKMDKATILGDAVKMVKQLQDKLLVLEERASKEGPTVVKSFEGRRLLGDDAGIHSGKTDNAHAGGLRDIEVRIAGGNNVFVRLHCEKIKGILVKVISELENLHMSVAHANILSFSESALDLTLSAQMEEGYEVTVDYIIKYLHEFLDRLK